MFNVPCSIKTPSLLILSITNPFTPIAEATPSAKIPNCKSENLLTLLWNVYKKEFLSLTPTSVIPLVVPFKGASHVKRFPLNIQTIGPGTHMLGNGVLSSMPMRFRLKVVLLIESDVNPSA
jgi:hypothetical protein